MIIEIKLDNIKMRVIIMLALIQNHILNKKKF